MAQVPENSSLYYGRCCFSTHIFKVLVLKVRTNRDAIICILNLADATSKLAGWRPMLSKMEFDVFHLVWIINQGVDALNRIPTTKKDCNPNDDAIPVWSTNTLQRDGWKGHIIPMTSLTTVMMMPLTRSLLNNPPYAQLKSQGRIHPYKC